MFKKKNTNGQIQMPEPRKAHIEQKLYSHRHSNKAPSRIICNKGEMTCIEIEIWPLYRPDHKGKAEKEFHLNRKHQNV